MKGEQTMENSTRVGRHVWDIDFEKMDIEELKALNMLCRDKIKQKQAEALYKDKLVELLAEAAEHNVQLALSNDHIYANLTAARFDIIAQEKDYWVD